MPAKSKAQQRLFGMVHAYQKGKLKHAPASVKRIAKHISKEDARHFAETKHEGLPETKKAEVVTMTRYEQGFLTKCAEYGLDADTSVKLMRKVASKPSLSRPPKKPSPPPIEPGSLDDILARFATANPGEVKKYNALVGKGRLSHPGSARMTAIKKKISELFAGKWFPSLKSMTTNPATREQLNGMLSLAKRGRLFL